MSTIYIHIGVPKTATTTLQREVFLKSTSIFYAGKPFTNEQYIELDPDRYIEKIIKEIRLSQSLSFNLDEAAKEISRLSNNIAKNNYNMIISEEGLSENRYIDRTIIANRLRKLFGNCKIIITIRNQSTAIPSLYFHYLKKGMPVESSFNKWYSNSVIKYRENNDKDFWLIKQYNYYELYNLYSSIFSPENIKILLYEEIMHNKKKFFTEISGFLKLENNELEKLYDDSKVRNQGISMSAIRMHNAYKKAMKLISGCKNKYFPRLKIRENLFFLKNIDKQIYQSGIKVLNRYDRRNKTDLINHEYNKDIYDTYKNSNRMLMGKLNLPLEKYNYPL